MPGMFVSPGFLTTPFQDQVGVGVHHNWSAVRCSGDPSQLDLFQQSLQSEQCWPKWSIELVGFVVLRKSMGSGIDRCQSRSAKLPKHGGGQEHQFSSHPLGFVTGEFVGAHCSLDRYQDFLTPVRMWSKDDLVLVHVYRMTPKTFCLEFGGKALDSFILRPKMRVSLANSSNPLCTSVAGSMATKSST